MKSFVIQKNDAGQRLDKFLSKAVPLLPPSLLYKSIRLKRIKLNRKRCEISTRLAEGDVLELYLNDEFFEKPEGPLLFLKAPAALHIVYEDENILLVDKKPGLIVHEDSQETVDTLINRILHYLYDKKEYCPGKEASFVPSLCNRIDRNTGGIVIAAKNAEALRVLNQKIKDRELVKLYLCIVHGQMPQKEGTLSGYLLKDPDKNKVTVFSSPSPGAKTAVTKYRVLDEKGRFSLLEADLLTGRTHQIRAQMAAAGHPLLGDTKYGFARDNKGTGYRYQALYSYRLTFQFSTGAGALEYLNHRTFAVEDVWFVQDFKAGRLGE